MNSPTAPSDRLRRDLGIAGATMLGLGSILGTGIFIALALSIQVAGVYVLPAIAVAAALAFCNGMSSAQLAARHPVSGGSYEYGYRWLSPTLGFAAGWMFLAAKSASAATAALGAAGYLLEWTPYSASPLLISAAVILTLLLTVLVLTGLRRSNRVNMVIVSVTILALLLLSLALLGLTPRESADSVQASVEQFHWQSFLEACALMFVAYTGYGRVATLGEELHDPERNIPKAILATLLVSMVLYLLTGWAIATHLNLLPNDASTAVAAPLEQLARAAGLPGIAIVVGIGAITAMLGVLLNLLLGLSRVWLAMGRRGDMPAALAKIDNSGSSPYVAVLTTGGVIAGLTCLGDLKTTWSFSAFTVLVYYAITNLSALQMTAEERIYPRVLPILGLCGCLGLAFWVEPTAWIAGLTVLAAGLLWRWGFRSFAGKPATPVSQPRS